MDDTAIRLALHTKLEAAFPNLPIFYIPPGNMELTRPCIVYEPKKSQPSFSNNTPYTIGTRFQVTLLSDIPGYDKRPMFSISDVVMVGNVTYTMDDVVHDVFTISVNSISS